jgi:tRNA-dihydrouridine synthase B
MTVIKIGPYTLASRTVLAPMAGVTDRPFRQLCKHFGAGLVVSEMVTSDTRLWNSRKSQWRLNHTGEQEPRSVQIAGSEPEMMANAARMNVERGAQIIDINMGCPAKKVCKKAAGSALLADEALVKDILSAVVNAVDVPVTLKIRTGTTPEQRNGIAIAQLAEDAGISALAVHGRTRACKFQGAVEYDTIAAIKAAIGIPVFANGDINNAQQARDVLEYTGADGVMIGRAAQGKPWIFQQINHFLEHGELLPEPGRQQIKTILLQHLHALHAFYGEFMGVQIARKHVGWYLKEHSNTDTFRKHFNGIDSAEQQTAAIEQFFETSQHHEEEAA